MAESAFQTRYRQEFIAGYERNQSLLRSTVTTEVETNGNQAVFLVADSGGASAVTRGLNGLIPARPDNLNQVTLVLQEWHDLVRRTGFNLFASQGDGRKIMQATTRAVLNRKIDDDILAALETGTQTTSAIASTMSLQGVMHAIAILGNNDVPIDGNITALISPGAYANLMMTPEFTSADFSNNKPFDGRQTNFRWAGINFIVHSGLTGAGTADEKVIVYHKSAIGHAFDTASLKLYAGYDEEQDYSYARASSYMGSKLLQNEGVVIIHNDGSAWSPAA